jgi:glycosyltransferase involved in cell wall biosynthesis
MRGADIFVSASHREGSGYALIESLACGLPVVVSDIPAFRALCGEGTVGRHFTPGDARGLAAALVECAAMPRTEARAAARARFETHISRASIGAQLVAAYRRLIARRLRAPAGMRA